MVRKSWLSAVGMILGALAVGCSDTNEEEGPFATPVPTTKLTGTLSDNRFYVADHMLASIEMQISGEPFAELLGRDIAGYDRFSADSNVYTDPETGEASTDTLGWALAIESYEYSKQPMNNTSFESGAGLSFQFAPSLNPEAKDGEEGATLLFDRIQYLGKASRASGAVFGKDFVTSPPDTSYPNNHLGWPAFWPVYAEFRSFDPTIAPNYGTTRGCDLGGAIDEPVPPELLPPPVADYECDYNTLNLVDRESQVEKVLEPDALGYAAWKQALWVINYWFNFHDIGQNPIEKVPEEDLAMVGIPGNSVIGQFPSPVDPTDLIFGKQGTFLGGVSLEGFQGLVMIDEMYGKSVFMLHQLMTTDGTSLEGFATTKDAVDYDYESALRWWPASVDVTETAQTADHDEALRLFPKPTKLTIASAESRMQDYAAMLGGFANLYGMTDENNVELGGSQMFRATFDGDPWPADDAANLGEDTPRDRALGIVKVALVNLDRLHFDGANQVLVDRATPASGQKGTLVDTVSSGQVILGLRTALRALNGSLSLYGNDTPDQLGAPNPLDQTSLDGAPFAGTVESRIVTLVRAQGTFLATKIMGSDGLAANVIDLSTGKSDGSPTTLAAQASLLRGLLEAYLVTSDETFRQASLAAYEALERDFWMKDVLAYRTTFGDDDRMEYTPKNFGVLQGALRQYFKLVATQPGFEAQAEEVLARVERSFKLVANGWNDTNGDQLVDSGECLGASFQMAERALTGELSRIQDAGDRDRDCVPDLATAGLPSALGGMYVLERD